MDQSEHSLIQALQRRVAGAVLTAGDPGYDAARTPYFSHLIGSPTAVVQPTDADDVAAAIRTATSSGTPLFVRSGGHTSHSTGDGLLLDLGSLTGFELDPDGRTAWVGAGMTARQLARRLAPHGLAVPLGDTGSTGLGGLTLGGGIGLLSRSHGLTIDHLIAAEIVTADGTTRIIHTERDPDLFWAIRGGGGNFGVATRFRYRLSTLPQVVGGLLIMPATPDSIAALVATCLQADCGLTVIATVLPAPPVPGLAPELVGSPVVMAQVCYVGDGNHHSVFSRLRAAGPTLFDALHPTTYASLLASEPPDRGERPAMANTFLDQLDNRAAHAIVDQLARARSPLRLVQIRVLGGAVAEAAADATAYGHRASPILLLALHGDQPDHDYAHRWARGITDDLDAGPDRAYVNFLGHHDADRVDAAYPAPTLARLRTIKGAVDPTNLFRHNVNISPG